MFPVLSRQNDANDAPEPGAFCRVVAWSRAAQPERIVAIKSERVRGKRCGRSMRAGKPCGFQFGAQSVYLKDAMAQVGGGCDAEIVRAFAECIPFFRGETHCEVYGWCILRQWWNAVCACGDVLRRESHGHVRGQYLLKAGNRLGCLHDFRFGLMHCVAGGD